ncbi:SAM-dependent methyltransferase [Spirillospora sp. NPDC049024]|uniref:SAM-dependent methyltransferase n=1 Tax=unclassified Actinomadura TaxID=2626254 RepID=UPI0011EE9749|nr:SAM-dependent methyltransferase [Actinomadura sp. K4S16]
MSRPQGVDTSVPSPARVYDHLLGGKDNYEVDRKVADGLLKIIPSMRLVARENRAFLGRAVRYLAGEAGIRQFLDIGTGLPTQDNVHDVAQRIEPAARVVYADNDPVVLVHARALLTSTPEGATDYVEADLREPDAILEHAAATLDFDEPVALLLVAILHFLPDEDGVHGIVARLVDRLAPGSYLVISHGTPEENPQGASDAAEEYTRQAPSAQITPRNRDAINGFFTGLEPVDPGLGYITSWRPEGPVVPPEQVGLYGGVARKP